MRSKVSSRSKVSFIALLILSLFMLTSLLRAEPVKLHVRDLTTIQQGLQSLDGANKVVGDKVVLTPYEFGGTTRWAIAYNLTEIRRQVAVYSDAKDAVVREIAKGGSRIEPDNTEGMAKFASEYQKLIDTEITVELLPIPLADLALDKNAIPGTVLSALYPVIKP